MTESEAWLAIGHLFELGAVRYGGICYRVARQAPEPMQSRMRERLSIFTPDDDCRGYYWPPYNGHDAERATACYFLSAMAEGEHLREGVNNEAR